MRYLKTNTATTITVGPFLDKTDGITPETAITVTGVHITLMVDNAGTPTLSIDADATASGGNNDMVHITNDDAGYYSLELTAAQLNYLGGALLSLNVVGTACPVFHEFTILPANIYDSMIAGTDLFDVSTTQFNGSAVTASSGRPEVNMSHIAGSAVSTSTAQLGVNVVNFGGSAGTFASGRPEVNTTHAAGTAWGSGAITAASIASNAITSAKIATDAIGATQIADNAIDAASIATGAITSAKFAAGAINAAAIADGAIDLATLASDIRPFFGIVAYGTAQSASATGLVLASSESFADDTLIGMTAMAYGSTQGYWQSRVITDNALTGDSISVDTWTVTPSGTITYLILGTPPASTSAPIAANVTQFGGVAGTFASGIPEVKVASIAANAITATSIASDAITDAKVASDVTIASVTGAVGSVTGNVGGNVVGSVASVTAGVTVTTNNDKTGYRLSATGVDDIWDEATSGHTTAGTTGKALTDAGSAGDPWSTALPGAYGAGTAGYLIGTNVDAPISTVDTVVDAIKAKTDSLTFTVAGKVDSNIKSVNNVTVNGDGAGTPWGP